MYSKVIVAEKPGVARAFAHYLSGGRYRRIRVGGVEAYEFTWGGDRCLSIGIRGHLMDYDFPPSYNRWDSVEPAKLFSLEPVMVVRGGMGKYVEALQRLARMTREVVLALDADVEGEAIAFEVMGVMRRSNPDLRFVRAWFSAVTRQDLLRALENPRDPDRRLADKAFARMQLDLTIGAAFTRALTLMVRRRGGPLPRGKIISYGPCQTPVLYLVVRRAWDRESFQKKKFYEVAGDFEADGFRFTGKLDKRFESRAEAEKLLSTIGNLDRAIVARAEYLEREEKPPEPLATVEMERRASRFLDIRPRDAMRIAEDLYQNGYISYPRTDTTIYPPTLNLRQIAGMFLEDPRLGRFVDKRILSRPELVPTRGREDDRAHPPIYPLRYAKREEVEKRLGARAWALYDLVVRHFLATLSPSMIVENQKIVVRVGEVPFVSQGLRILDPGYTAIYPFERPRERILPYLMEGDEVHVRRLYIVEAETKPPPYLSEAELLRLMKKYGIGTDATMQEHIHTNVERRYFVVNRRRCIPTALGKTLIQSLHSVVPEATLPEVRGNMERELAAIAEGSKEPSEVVASVKSRFLQYFNKLAEAEDRVAQSLVEALREIYGSDRPERASRRPRGNRGR